jgi:hypothetical protein
MSFLVIRISAQFQNVDGEDGLFKYVEHKRTSEVFKSRFPKEGTISDPIFSIRVQYNAEKRNYSIYFFSCEI